MILRVAVVLVALALTPLAAEARVRFELSGGALAPVGTSDTFPLAGLAVSWTPPAAEPPVGLRLRGHYLFAEGLSRLSGPAGLDLNGVWRSEGERLFVGASVGAGLWRACSDERWCALGPQVGLLAGYARRVTPGLVLELGAQAEAHLALTGTTGLLFFPSAFAALRFE